MVKHNARVWRIHDHKPGFYLVQWVGAKKRDWVPVKDTAGCVSLVEKFWSRTTNTRVKNMEHKIKTHRRFHKQLQQRLGISEERLSRTRKTLNTSFDRESDSLTQLKEMEQKLITRNKELGLSEVVVSSQQKRISQLERELAKTRGALDLAVRQIRTHDKLIPEIVRYDLGEDKYIVKSDNGMKIEARPTSDFGLNAHKITVFWVRVLLSNFLGVRSQTPSSVCPL